MEEEEEIYSDRNDVEHLGQEKWAMSSYGKRLK